GSITIASNLAPGPYGPTTVELVHLDDRIEEFPAAGADAYGEMLDQFAAVVHDDAVPRWGADESRLLARWIDRLHAAAR
ncbi:MAG: hypothetical protein WD023_11530, partial [Ilumatobacteraceae bacterium]